jgi:hypothetical protein
MASALDKNERADVTKQFCLVCQARPTCHIKIFEHLRRKDRDRLSAQSHLHVTYRDLHRASTWSTHGARLPRLTADAEGG